MFTYFQRETYEAITFDAQYEIWSLGDAANQDLIFNVHYIQWFKILEQCPDRKYQDI